MLTKGPPGYETKSSYRMLVRVRDGRVGIIIAVAINVTNVEELGRVTVSPTTGDWEHPDGYSD